MVSLPGALRWLEAGFDGAGEEGVEDDGVGASRSQQCVLRGQCGSWAGP